MTPPTPAAPLSTIPQLRARRVSSQALQFTRPRVLSGKPSREDGQGDGAKPNNIDQPASDHEEKQPVNADRLGEREAKNRAGVGRCNEGRFGASGDALVVP